MGRKFSKIENLWPRDDSCSHTFTLFALFFLKKSIALEAKTDELAKHYIRDFGTIQVFAKQSGGTLMDIEVKRMSPTAVEMPA